MQHQRHHHRHRISDDEGGIGVRRRPRHQHEQRRRCRAEVGERQQRQRAHLPEARQRHAQPLRPQHRDAARAQHRQDREQRQQAAAQRPRPGGIERHGPQRHALSHDQPEPRRPRDARPKGDRADRRHLRHLAEGQAGGTVQPQPRRPAGQQRQPQIVAQRVTGERPRRRDWPRQRLAHRAQRDPVEAGQHQIARHRQRQARGDPRIGHRRQRRAHVAQMHLAQHQVQRLEPDGGDQQHRGDHQLAPMSRDEGAARIQPPVEPGRAARRAARRVRGCAHRNAPGTSCRIAVSTCANRPLRSLSRKCPPGIAMIVACGRWTSGQALSCSSRP